MEKPTTKTKKKKSKSLFNIIPKAAQAASVSFQNLPFSPRRDKRSDANAHKHKSHLFSGPLIPLEARGRSNKSVTPEPSSPKVSCIGQIKYKKSLSTKKHDSRPKELKPGKVKKTRPIASPLPQRGLVKKASGISKIFSAGRKSDAAIEHMRAEVADDSPPRLGQMRKFASSRDALANFDWSTSQIAPEEHVGRECFSDEERDSSDGEDEVIIPFSAPILMRSGTGLDSEPPRTEINLWKRRTMARPKPLKLTP